MRRSSTILAVTSGKGGVGKSVVAVNLAQHLAQEGHEVVLIDADFGQSDCAILLNESPAHSLMDVVEHRRHVTDVFHRTDGGFTLVQAAPEAHHATYEPRLYAALDALLLRLRRQYDYIIIDTPAGIDERVRWALDRADLGIVVLVGEPTAVADAYRLCKMTWEADPAYPLGLLVNYADDADDARSVAERFGAITEKFTGQTPLSLGWVPFSASVRRATAEQRPFVCEKGPATEAFSAFAQVLVNGHRQVPVPVSA